MLHYEMLMVASSYVCACQPTHIPCFDIVIIIDMYVAVWLQVCYTVLRTICIHRPTKGLHPRLLFIGLWPHLLCTSIVL